MGKLIVIEGLDGSGKATQAKLLYNALKNKGENIVQVTFPNYESNSSALVKMYLSGEFGTNVNDVNAYASSLFFGVDRYASFKTQWSTHYNDGGIVVCDRYTTSNAVHQCCKTPKEKWDEFLNWLFETEYEKIAIPKPDIVIYLDVEPSISQNLMTQRYKGSESKKDIHEKDVGYLNDSREVANYCANKYNWLIIKCTKDGKMRSIEDIHQEILTKI